MLIAKPLLNQKGMAALELVPIAIITVLLLSFCFGFFGVVHTGVLNSIAARNYAFETFNHRVDLNYFRSTQAGLSDDKLKTLYYGKQKYRTHSIASDRRPATNEELWATSREIAFGWDFGRPELVAAQDSQYHQKGIHEIRDDGTRYTARAGVNPVWIQSTYGICLNSKCESD